MFQVRHELASRVFTCCSFIIKHDYKVTIYLLPHILLYMLLGCTPAEQQEVRPRAPTPEVPAGLFSVFMTTMNLFPGHKGDAGRADRGGRTGRGALPGDGLQPLAAQHADRVQHVLPPDTVEPPHPLLQAQKQRSVRKRTFAVSLHVRKELNLHD